MKKNAPSSIRSSVAKPLRSISFIIVFLSINFLCSAQQELIKDLNITQDIYQMEYRFAADVNGMLYFSSNQELWRTNGRASGSILLKRFSFITAMVSYRGALYVAAMTDGDDGLELWRSTGATYSTVLLKDIRPGNLSSEIEQFTVSGNYLYFVANDGIHGKELWRTDGTSVGTIMVKDIQVSGGSSKPAFLTDVNGTLFFAANDGIHGFELWKSNGTAGGTVMVKDVRTGTRLSSSPGQITNVDGVAFFTADDGISGRELWKSDGSAAGTLLVKDFTSGSGSGNYRNMTGVNNTLYFSANDRTHGEEVWKSDGTSAGTVIVKDLYPGSQTKTIPGGASSVPALRNFTSVNGKLYFTGYGPDGYYFWKTDGTAEGTVALKEAHNIGGGPVTPYFTYYNGSVFFLDGAGENEDGIFSYGVHKEDGAGVITTIATYFMADFYSTRAPFLVLSRDQLYFVGRQTLDDGYALFKSGGTAASTQKVIDAYSATNSSEPQNFVKLGNVIYFIAKTGSGEALWKTNGTTAGTLLVKEFEGVNSLMEVNGQLYFVAETADGSHVYRSDGTAQGTAKIPVDFPGRISSLQNVNGKLFATDWNSTSILTIKGTTYNLYAIGATVRDSYPLGNYLYFQGYDIVNGTELWRTDGTLGGTKLVKNIHPSAGSEPQSFAALNGVLYFRADDGTHGNELWRSNGSSAGTYMVKDVRGDDTTWPSWDDFTDIASVGGKIYFFSQDASDQPALWTTDGTSANTIKVIDVPALSGFMISGSRMYFTTIVYPDYKLWKTDGTAESTEVLVSNNGSFYYSSHITIDGIFYSNFRRDQLFRSDGTPCGTFAIPGTTGAPDPVTYLDGNLIYSANDGMMGRELFKFDITQVPESPCATASPTVAMEKEIQNYPNPFDATFALTVPGDGSTSYNIQIVDQFNNVFEIKSEMKHNETYQVGAQLPSGLYMLRVSEGEKVSVRRIVKR